jgi:excisionase family DNA binding protein
VSGDETTPEPACTPQCCSNDVPITEIAAPTTEVETPAPNRATRRAAARAKTPDPTPTGVGPVVGLREAGEHVGMSIHALREWIHAGKLPAYRLGQRWRVRIEDLENLLVPNGPT